MEPILDSVETTFKGKIYKERGIWLATFLGGPLVTGYLMAANFKAFGEQNKIGTTWIIAVLATISSFALAYFVPAIAQLPRVAMPVVTAGIANVLVITYQRNNITIHISNGGEVYSNWRAFGISMIIAIPLALIAVGAMFLATRY